jgi:Fic-DOC domain mobile mystery protein B
VNKAIFENEDGAATPLTPEERDDLIPSYIALRRELNEAEHIGITEADRWAFARKRNILNEAFLKNLHKRMFKDIWRWAGAYRKTPRNIGVEVHRIIPDLYQLIDDTQYWVDHRTYAPDAIALRFHHRLVYIHPFPNGNGRHARLAADLLITQLGQERFSWGCNNLVESHITRAAYKAALRAADGHDYEPLFIFARS